MYDALKVGNFVHRTSNIVHMFFLLKKNLNKCKLGANLHEVFTFAKKKKAIWIK